MAAFFDQATHEYIRKLMFPVFNKFHRLQHSLLARNFEKKMNFIHIMIEKVSHIAGLEIGFQYLCYDTLSIRYLNLSL